MKFEKQKGVNGMMPNKIKHLQDLTAQLERLCDNRDLITEKMKDVIDEANAAGFDVDALVTIVLCRIEARTSLMATPKEIEYLNALGDLKQSNQVAA